MDKEKKCENCKWYFLPLLPRKYKPELEDEHSHFEHLGKCQFIEVDEEMDKDKLPQWAHNYIIRSEDGDILNNNVSPDYGEKCPVWE